MSVEVALSGVSCVLCWHILSLPAWTHESTMCWVSCVLCWHFLSEGQSTTSVDTRVYNVLSVVRVELARLVVSVVVERITDRWHRAAHHALKTTIHLDGARHFVDHLLSWMIHPFITCVRIKSLLFQSNADHPWTGYTDRKRGRNAESFIRIVLFTPSLSTLGLQLGQPLKIRNSRSANEVCHPKFAGSTILVTECSSNVVFKNSKLFLSSSNGPTRASHFVLFCSSLCYTEIVFCVGSGPRRHFPLLPSVSDDLVTCLRACAALARLPRRLWTRWTIAGQVLRVIVSHVTRKHRRGVGRVQLLVDNG